MSEQDAQSLGSLFAERFAQARQELGKAPRRGRGICRRLWECSSMELPVCPIENLYVDRDRDRSKPPARFFCLVTTLQLEDWGRRHAQLAAFDHRMRTVPSGPCPAGKLPHLRDRGGDSPTYFPPPGKFVATLLRTGPTRDSLPRIVTYARRPVYDEDFVLRGPGYNAEQDILVHGLDIEPILPGEIDVEEPIIERLPPRLRMLLGGFCFREPADVANGLAALLTGALSATTLCASRRPARTLTPTSRASVRLGWLSPQVLCSMVSCLISSTSLPTMKSWPNASLPICGNDRHRC